MGPTGGGAIATISNVYPGPSTFRANAGSPAKAIILTGFVFNRLTPIRYTPVSGLLLPFKLQHLI